MKDTNNNALYENNDSKIELIKINNLICKKKFENYGLHYYGWKSVMTNFIENYSSIKNQNMEQIFFDEWIEKLLVWEKIKENKAYINKIIKNNYKFISFLHNPPFQKWNNKEYKINIRNSIIYNEEHTNKNLFNVIEYHNLNKNLQYLYTLTNKHKEYLYNKFPSYQNNLISVLHPIKITGKEKTFDFSLFCQNKQIFHIGWWLRNFKTFIHFEQPKDFYKTILIKNSFENEWITLSKNYNLDNITILKELENSDYERIFINSCMFLDLEDTTANNIILECIKFNTPVIVKKLPGVVEYLGTDYPLYFENDEQLSLLQNTNYFLNLIEKANTYLEKMDKTHVHPDTFNKKIIYDIKKIQNTTINKCYKYELTWFYLVTNLVNYNSKLQNLYKNFANQNNNDINILKIVIDIKLINDDNYQEFINFIDKYNDFLSNIQYVTINIDCYSSFLNNCFSLCETNYFTTVDAFDKHHIDFSNIFINYLDSTPSCDIAFSSYSISDKHYEENIIFKKNTLIFDSNFSNIIFPENGIVYRKELSSLMIPFNNLINNSSTLRDYFKNIIKKNLNIKCCHEKSLYTITKK